MPVSETATTLFLETLMRWVEGALKRDFAEAEFQRQQLQACGKLLTQHPHFAFHDGGTSADEALEGMVALMRAVADARLPGAPN